MASACRPLNDNVFGPVVQGCRSGFDFTLLFEQTILSIGPAALLLISTPLRLFRLLQATKKTISTRLRSLKALTALFLVGVQLGLVIAWAPNTPTRTTLPASILSLFASLAILVLSIFEHSRSVRPSFIVNIYLFASLSFDAVQTRTLYLRHEAGTILGLFTANIVLKAILVLLESRSKRNCLKSPYNSYPPEATSGIFSQCFFWWLNPVLATGFRKLLTLDDLFKPDIKLLSGPLQEQAQSSWDKYRTSGRVALLYTIFHCIRWPLASMVFPRLCLVAFNYAQPFLISSAINFVSQPVQDQNKNDGYGLIGATALIYLGIAISTTNYTHQIYRAITIFRGSTVSLIYAKTVQLQADVYDESSALTLMSSDIDRLATSLQAACEIWARAIEMAVGLWLLARQIGWVCVAPIVIVVVCIYFSSIVARRIGPRQKEWIQAIQRRVAMTSSTLGSMKSVKMMGLSDSLFESLQNQRVIELELSKKFRVMGLWRLFLSFVPTLMAPLFCFIIFAIEASVNGSGRLTASQTFSSFAIISLLTAPASDFLQSLPQIGMATGCLDRIQKFLLSDPCRDDRNLSDPSPTIEIAPEDHKSAIQLMTLSPAISSRPAVNAQELHVRPSLDSPVVLHGLNFLVPQKSLAMIVGTVGSGKSTLLKSIIGELRYESGTLNVASKSFAYCSQSPWLPNATVRQIVCGASTATITDLQWYETVLHSCAFDEDVRALPNHDDTLIGSRGVTLSGGQKQRLALARAVYARRDINVLDDVLSAIDAKTERLVVDRLFGKDGLFRKLGSTVILATHAVRHLPLSDQIIVLGADGKVTEQGTFDHLRSLDGFVNKLILHPDLLQSKAEDSQSVGVSTNKPSGSKALQCPSASDAADLARRVGDVSVYKYYLRFFGWKLASVSITSSVIYVFAAKFPTLWLNWYANGTVTSLPFFAVIFVISAVVALAAIVAVLFNLYMQIIPATGASLHKVLLRSVMGAPQSFFDETDSGVTLNRFSQDMTLIDGQLPISLVLTLTSVMQCLASIALIAVGSSYMAITCPAIVLAIYCLQYYYLRTSRQMRFLDLECKSPLYTHFTETLEGLSTIRTFGWQEHFITTNLDRLDDSQRPYYMMYCIQRWLMLVLQLLIAGMVVVVVALATSLSETTNGGRLGVSLSSVVTFNASLAMLLYFWTQTETSLGAISRLKGFEEQTVSENMAQETFVPSEEWPSSGAIELQNVSASYGQNAPALRDISFRVNPGEKIGICGRTGSGKSSLLSILLRIIDINSGSLSIDGLNLQVIRRETIRSRLITIPQDPFILSGSVRLNADPAGTATDKAIILALEKVRLWDILESRGGLDATMNVNPLSQGQQQIFCLARAMLRTAKGKILVLDEATSSVDSETDLLMQRLIRAEFSDYTVLTVAHRLDTIMDSDRIIVLDAGKLVEMGPPDELLKQHGAFWGLRGSSRSD